ncbi:MAG: winged helix-turn-helix domain-containing protein, partial [Hyphomicrobiales bacterium]|nr:winged helix-turn-helix domain-containing protein [Hyphomicrobiales bacterium]
MAIAYRFGPFALDVAAGILFCGDRPTMLGGRAVALLERLVGAEGAPISKDDLIEAAWPGLVVEDSNLTVQIAALRRALQEGGGASDWIATLPRRGYRYAGPAVATAGAEAPPALALPGKASIAVLPFRDLSE